MAKINIHDGDGTSEPVKRLALRIQTDLNLGDLVDGICSRYAVHFPDHFPESMKEAELLEILRTEYLCHGTQGVWQWAKDMPEERELKYRNQARNLILAAIPAMKEAL